MQKNLKKSLNKNKTIWDIVNLETYKTGNTEKIDSLNLDGNSISDHQETANAFNKCVLTMVKSINPKQNELSSHNLDNTTPLHYLMQSFKNPFPNINLKSYQLKKLKT